MYDYQNVGRNSCLFLALRHLGLAMRLRRALCYVQSALVLDVKAAGDRDYCANKPHSVPTLPSYRPIGACSSDAVRRQWGAPATAPAPGGKPRGAAQEIRMPANFENRIHVVNPACAYGAGREKKQSLRWLSRQRHRAYGPSYCARTVPHARRAAPFVRN